MKYKCILLIAFLSFLLGIAYIQEQEIFLSFISQETSNHQNLLKTTLQNEVVSAPVLYTSIASLFESCSIYPLRIISLVSLIILAFLSSLFFQKITNEKSILPAIICMSSFGAMYFVIHASSYILTALFINIAWAILYYYGFFKNKWEKAWLLSHLFLAMSFLNSGFIVFLLYYVPLLFIGRPLKLRRRLFRSKHWIIFAIVSFGLIISCLLYKDIKQDEISLLFSVANDNSHDFLLFPLKSCWYFFPWIIFIWPSFCLRFKPLQEYPILQEFLTIICQVVFVLCWVLWIVDFAYMTLLIAPLAIQITFFYKLYSKRYKYYLERIFFILNFILLISFCVSLFYFNRDFIWIYILILMSIFILQFINYKKQLYSNLIQVLLVFVSTSLIFIVFEQNTLDEDITSLKNTLDKNQVIYVLGEEKIYASYFYFNLPIVTLKDKIIRSPENIQGNKADLAYRYYGHRKLKNEVRKNYSLRKRVYVLSANKPTNYTSSAIDYTWTKISNLKNDISLWQGDLN